MSANPLLPLYGPLYGALHFSALMSTGFYSITCMQTFFYYVHYQNDPSYMKGIIAALWSLDTIHECLVISGVYKFMMIGLENPISSLNGLPPSQLHLPGLPRELFVLLTCLVAVGTQGYFVTRIYNFSGKNVIVPITWLITAALGLVSGTIYVGRALYGTNDADVVRLSFLSDSTNMLLVTLCLASATGIDILIAILLTYLLVRKRTATGFTNTSHMLQRLTVLAVNTGIWTAIFATLTLALMRIFQSNLLFTVFGVPICPIYCNTLLGNLNARKYIRGEATTHNFGADLFTGSSPSAPDGTTSDGQRIHQEGFAIRERLGSHELNG